MKNYFILGAVFFFMCSTSDPVLVQDLVYAEKIGTVVERELNEISGMAQSQIHDNVLWVINDSGNDAVIYAIDKSGELLGEFEIANVRDRDWEDLSSFIWDGKAYLAIAETGDNDSRYDESYIYILPEPDTNQALPASIEIAWQIAFTFPEGALDCEAMTVDMQQQKVLLLSKRTQPPALYELPLFTEDKAIVATLLGYVFSIPKPKQEEVEDYLDQFHAQPTSMDIRRDGSQIAILTYRHLFLYNKEDKWMDALNTAPTVILYPTLTQAESMCYDADQQCLLITTEKLPAPIIQIDPTKL